MRRINRADELNTNRSSSSLAKPLPETADSGAKLARTTILKLSRLLARSLAFSSWTATRKIHNRLDRPLVTASTWTTVLSLKMKARGKFGSTRCVAHHSCHSVSRLFEAKGDDNGQRKSLLFFVNFRFLVNFRLCYHSRFNYRYFCLTWRRNKTEVQLVCFEELRRRR